MKQIIIIFLLCALAIVSSIFFYNKSKNSEVVALPSSFAKTPQNLNSLLKNTVFTDSQTPFKCPEKYEDKIKYVEDLKNFIADYEKENPNATMANIGIYRVNLNNCQKTLDYLKKQ